MQQPPQLNRRQRFIRWYYRQSQRTRILVLIAIFAGIVFVCAAAASGLVQGIQLSLEPTPTSAPQPTQAPMPTPTPRTAPTKTQVQQILATDQADTPAIVSYDQKSGVLVASTIIGELVGVGQSAVKQTLQDIQSTIWKSGDYFSSVTVEYLQYQQTGAPMKLASATLAYKTEQGLDPNSPIDWWDSYDQKFMDPSVPNF